MSDNDIKKSFDDSAKRISGINYTIAAEGNDTNDPDNNVDLHES